MSLLSWKVDLVYVYSSHKNSILSKQRRKSLLRTFCIRMIKYVSQGECGRRWPQSDVIIWSIPGSVKLKAFSGMACSLPHWHHTKIIMLILSFVQLNYESSEPCSLCRSCRLVPYLSFPLVSVNWNSCSKSKLKSLTAKFRWSSRVATYM